VIRLIDLFNSFPIKSNLILTQFLLRYDRADHKLYVRDDVYHVIYVFPCIVKY
jgi:hypothetical protein